MRNHFFKFPKKAKSIFMKSKSFIYTKSKTRNYQSKAPACLYNLQLACNNLQLASKLSIYTFFCKPTERFQILTLKFVIEHNNNDFNNDDLIRFLRIELLSF